MNPTVIILLKPGKFKIVDRGDMGTIDLLNVLKTISSGMQSEKKKIDSGKSVGNVCTLTLYPFGSEKTDIKTGGLKVDEMIDCIEEVERKYAREIVGEVEELQGILKGKDLERYLDLMIKQNNAKGNMNN